MFSKGLSICHGSHGSSMAAKATIVPVAIGTLAMLGMPAGVASANIITNGDFSANAAAYTTSPGYSASPNPAAPTGWTVFGSTFAGVNGTDTGVGAPFAPTSTVGVNDFAFIQEGNDIAYDGVKQTVSTTAGQPYTLTYDASGRAGDVSGTDVLEVILTDTTNNNQITTQTPAITQAAFNVFTLNFTAPSASTNVEFLNAYPNYNYGSTVDVTNVAMAAVPEPACLGVLAIGGLGLLLLKRRRAV